MFYFLLFVKLYVVIETTKNMSALTKKDFLVQCWRLKFSRKVLFQNFSETDEFVVQVCGEAIPAVSKNRIDAYADAFEAFERGL